MKEPKETKPFTYAFGMMELQAKYNDMQEITDFVILHAHTSFPKLAGYPVQDLLGKNASDLLPVMKEVDPQWPGIFKKALIQNQTFEKEEFGLYLQRWLLIQVSPRQPNRVIVLITDITREKGYQTDLRRFLELDLDLLAISGPQGPLLKFNPAWEQVLGYSQKELVSIDFQSLIHPDDRPGAEKNTERLQSGQQINNYINRVRAKDGSYKYLEWRSRMFDDLVYASARDVTDRVLKSQKRDHQSELESLILNLAMQFIHLPQEDYDKAMNDMLALIGNYAKIDRGYIFTYDFDNRTTSNTHEWCAPGVSPEIENLQDIPIDAIPDWVNAHLEGQLLHIPDVDALDPETGLYQILHPQGIKTLITLPLTHKDKCLGFVGFDDVRTNHPWTDNELSILKMAANIITNSLIKYQITDELVRAKEEAEAMSKAKSQFLANMSHEIRTPLNAVIGFTDLLRGTDLSDTQKQYVETAYLSANALMDIISEVLDFSKIEAGRLELDVMETDLIKLVEQTADMIKHNCAQKGLELLLKLDWTLPRYIVVDPVRLKQILTNLLGNAVKFTEKGEVEFELRFLEDNQKENTGTFEFLIKDTGIGITEAQQNKLFKAFSQAESSTTRRYGGTGLGLAISNGLLDMMGSHIQLQSEYGQGSTFSFRLQLPYRRGREIRHEKIEHIQKVLIVDDNINQQNILAESLRQWKLKYELAGNGLAAMEKLNRDHDIDLVLLDYDMPHLNGLETLHLIRKQERLRHLRVFLMVPSFDDHQVRQATLELPAVDILSKPVKVEGLFEKLKNLKPQEFQVPEEEENHPPSHLGDVVAIETPIPKILLVEDFPMNRLLIKTMVSKFLPKVDITEVENGLEAVKAVKKSIPDLVFMDIQMPEMDGYEATQEIRALLKDSGHQPIIIALTANALKGEREKCLSIGMDDYLTKPVQKEVIKEKLFQYLNVPLHP